MDFVSFLCNASTFNRTGLVDFRNTAKRLQAYKTGKLLRPSTHWASVMTQTQIFIGFFTKKVGI